MMDLPLLFKYPRIVNYIEQRAVFELYSAPSNHILQLDLTYASEPFVLQSLCMESALIIL